MTTAVIVQARFGSSRLPGKILKPLGGSTPLAHVLARCARIPGIDDVVCAVADGLDDEPVAALARHCGATVFRGSAHDVLDRYHQAARAVGARIVMRVTSDCPLIDPTLCGEVLESLDATGADYVCNNMPPTWPHGLDCDAFPAELLARAAATARRPADREHVTLWLKRNRELRRINLDGPGGGAERHRWTLDYPADYDFFAALWAVMGERVAEASMAEILTVLAAHPEIVALNRAHIDEERLADRSIRPDARIAGRALQTA